MYVIRNDDELVRNLLKLCLHVSAPFIAIAVFGLPVFILNSIDENTAGRMDRMEI